MDKRVKIKVFGKVQGVSYRYGVEKLAGEMDLKGWVANMPDGTVEIEAEGEEEGLNKLVDWCKQGSEYAEVENVEVERGEASGEFDSFERR